MVENQRTRAMTSTSTGMTYSAALKPEGVSLSDVCSPQVRGDVTRLCSCSCGPMMLDVLFKIKDEMDPTLAFRRSCRYALLPRFIVMCFTLICAVGSSFRAAS